MIIPDPVGDVGDSVEIKNVKLKDAPWETATIEWAQYVHHLSPTLAGWRYRVRLVRERVPGRPILGWVVESMGTIRKAPR